MEPIITKIADDNEQLQFTISDINVSFINALRRTILSDININVCITDKYETNQCTIKKNTTRFHNEIIKHRLSCIPIHMKELDVLPGNYHLEVNVENDTDDVMYVTTEDFRIKNKNTNNYLTREEVMKIYPVSKLTNQYIDFLRLRPKIGDTIKGECINLTCDYSISNNSYDSAFNVACICSYGNTIDLEKANSEWEKKEMSLKGESMTEKEISFEKKNFYILDAQRYFIKDTTEYHVFLNHATDSGSRAANFFFPTTMRAQPSMTANPNAGSITFTSRTTGGVGYTVGGSVNNSTKLNDGYVADAEL